MKEKVKYPVKFMIKIILDNSKSHEENQQNIIAIFEKLNIRYLNFTYRKSAKGNYISYSASITVNTEKILYQLYDEVKNLENFKFAI